jgi:hypothetical protein
LGWVVIVVFLILAAAGFLFSSSVVSIVSLLLGLSGVVVFLIVAEAVSCVVLCCQLGIAGRVRWERGVAPTRSSGMMGNVHVSVPFGVLGAVSFSSVTFTTAAMVVWIVLPVATVQGHLEQ